MYLFNNVKHTECGCVCLGVLAISKSVYNSESSVGILLVFVFVQNEVSPIEYSAEIENTGHPRP